MNDQVQVRQGWLERSGKPWFPITGEIHYSRIRPSRWNEVLGLAAAGGLTSVATYSFWRHHEPEQGHYRWSEGLNLRRFVELAAEHGLEVVARIGPWSHGEARFGGFPDWLVNSGVPLRCDDRRYLAHVRRYWRQIAGQLEGLMHHQGGPVIAMQVENELFDDAAHLQTLRGIAEDLGLRVPLWTGTGWGAAQLPDSLLPVFSGYADGFWADSQTEWPDFSRPHFELSQVRDDSGTGEDVRQALQAPGDDPGSEASGPASARSGPFLTCELGGGMHVAYHRRPLVRAQDVAALALAKVATGSAWQGYYMYAGGSQQLHAPGGAEEQESQASGYPNDVPQVSYDFYAPIGEHGQVRPHYHLLRRQHMWLHAWGEQLLPMETVASRIDDDGPSWTARSDGASGFLFVSSYLPSAADGDRSGRLQAAVPFDDGELRIPAEPVELPAGVSAAWPLRCRLSDEVTLRYATAQLVTRIAAEDRDSPSKADLVVLCASSGVPAELVIEDGTAAGERVDLPGPPGRDCLIRLPGVELLVVDEATADQLYVLGPTGHRRIEFFDEPVWQDPQAADGGLRILRRGAPTVLLQELSPDAEAPEPRSGGPAQRLSAPGDFSGAARVAVQVPDSLFDRTDRLLLRVQFTGDVGRAWVGQELISDHFWHGRAWEMDLTEHRGEIARDGLRLELLPWRADAGVWVHPSVRDVPDGVHIRSVSAVPLRTEPVHPSG
ncbi:beta-galactosidase [Nesterenkonia sp.]|uniref:beta-galactosidase n=1 Tax=Nesterenkonia sp. TaxID=704201 RepID=UPI002618CA0A|nr:beta-galactosidase [Nesterenkonia sp.]